MRGKRGGVDQGAKKWRKGTIEPVHSQKEKGQTSFTTTVAGDSGELKGTERLARRTTETDQKTQLGGGRPVP